MKRKQSPQSFPRYDDAQHIDSAAVAPEHDARAEQAARADSYNERYLKNESH